MNFNNHKLHSPCEIEKISQGRENDYSIMVRPIQPMKYKIINR